MRVKLFINTYFFSSSTNSFFFSLTVTVFIFYYYYYFNFFFRVYIPIRLRNGLRGNDVGQTAIGLYCSKLVLLINLD